MHGAPFFPTDGTTDRCARLLASSYLEQMTQGIEISPSLRIFRVRDGKAQHPPSAPATYIAHLRDEVLVWQLPRATEKALLDAAVRPAVPGVHGSSFVALPPEPYPGVNDWKQRHYHPIVDALLAMAPASRIRRGREEPQARAPHGVESAGPFQFLQAQPTGRNGVGLGWNMEAPVFWPPAQSTPDLGIVHQAVHCDECKTMPIRGTRFRCGVCSDYDLCSACFAKPTHTHHPFHRIFRADAKTATPLFTNT